MRALTIGFSNMVGEVCGNPLARPGGHESDGTGDGLSGSLWSEVGEGHGPGEQGNPFSGAGWGDIGPSRPFRLDGVGHLCFP